MTVYQMIIYQKWDMEGHNKGWSNETDVTKALVP